MTIADKLQRALDVDRGVRSWSAPEKPGERYMVNGRPYTLHEAADKWCVSDLFDPTYPKVLTRNQAIRQTLSAGLPPSYPHGDLPRKTAERIDK